MYFQFACPSCQKNLKVREENAGSRVRCPYCHTTLTVKAPKTGQLITEPETSDHVLNEGSGIVETIDDTSVWSAAGTDVSMWRSGIYGLAATILFYIIVIPFRDFLGHFGALFLAHGWVPYALTFVAFWSLAILFLKSKKLTRQKDSLLFDLLPTDIAEDITARTAPQFMQHIRSLPANPNESFLISRVLRGLEHFHGLQSNSEVASRLASQSDIDANAVASSYTSLKVIVWAIPILGFIGTVIGLGAAAVSFSGSLGAESSVVKESLNAMMIGLATAFDTTLLALVLSLFVMFPMSSMQKAEEDLLNLVDEYCNDNLLKRLKDAGRGTSNISTDYSRTVQKAIDAAMADHHAELKTWSKKLESIGETLTNQIVSGWTNVDGQLQARQRENLEQVRSALGTIVEQQKLVASRLENLQGEQGEQFERVLSAADEQARAISRGADERSQRVEKDLAGLLGRYEQTLAGLVEQGGAVQAQLADSMRTSAQSLGDHFTAIRDGLTSLNAVLEKLGDQHTILEVRDASRKEPARGWGLFRRKNGVQ